MDDVDFRRARPDDAPALAHLARLTFVQTFVEDFAIPYPPADLEAFLTRACDPDLIRRDIERPDVAVWIALEQGRAVGFASAGPNTLTHDLAAPGDAELRKLYVARAAQGTGLGRRLLSTALDWMGDDFPGAQWIGVWSGNERAQAVYADRGFVRVGAYDYPVGDWSDHEFILRRERPA